ncbi:hypothetical protein [Spirosoma foliorum]|uniref:Uncharacterized protein n=1 Tax=Spirosoma foliorum TaxID=2710596 RepID=A0A7G5GVX9_9BACT|nr:hypothetical protein [Spirosoma foliorum]QMW03021.1 hypothetical protein H3H32_34930 [Spirosoma foliorum]
MPHTNKNLDKWVTRKKSGIPSAGSRATAQIPAVKRKHAFARGYQQRLILHATKVKGRPTIGLPAVYGRWGRNQISSTKTLDKKKYRMNQIQHRANFGGTGLDEMVSTATVGKIVQHMKDNRRSLEDIKNVTDLLSREREEVRYLLWTTNEQKRPLSGHPGALSQDQGDMRRGLTGDHGTKDRLRGKWVLNQYNSKAGTEEDRLTDTSIMANIMTNQLFSEPFAQLDTVSPTGSTQVGYHPVHGSIYKSKGGIKTKTLAFRKAAIDTHNSRERRKWATAERLINRGYKDLVHPAMYKWIEAGKGWSQGLSMYMESVKGEQNKDTGATSSTAYLPVKDGDMFTLSQWNDRARKGLMGLAVGSPRPLMRRASPISLITPRTYKQQLLTAYFRHAQLKTPPNVNPNL